MSFNRCKQNKAGGKTYPVSIHILCPPELFLKCLVKHFLNGHIILFAPSDCDAWIDIVHFGSTQGNFLVFFLDIPRNNQHHIFNEWFFFSFYLVRRLNLGGSDTLIQLLQIVHQLFNRSICFRLNAARLAFLL